MPLDRRLKDQIERLFGNPELIPDSFWSALLAKMQNAPTFQVSRDQLPADTTLFATDSSVETHKVVWRSAKNSNAVIADVQAYTGVGPTLVAESIGHGATTPSQAFLLTQNPDDTHSPQVILTVENNQGYTTAKSRAGVYITRESDGVVISKTIFDSLGGSDFVLGNNAVTAYTPAWTSNGTQPAIGNGTIVGRYQQAGKMVFANAKITMGTTTTYGTGVYFISLPVAGPGWLGPVTVRAFDSSASATYMASAIWNTTTTIFPITLAQPAVGFGPTVPFTWAAGDILEFGFLYEAS